jgi:hypothetical protein
VSNRHGSFSFLIKKKNNIFHELFINNKTKTNKMSTYADLVVHSVEIHATEFKDQEAVTKSYVDTKLNDLVAGAPQALDTLNEIAQRVEQGSSVSEAIIDSINSTKADLNAEIVARQTETTGLQNQVFAEASAREQAVSQAVADISVTTSLLQSQQTAIAVGLSEEVSSRTAAFESLQENIHHLQQTKFDVSPYYSGNSETHFTISQDAYLYIGPLWRLSASTSGSKKKLCFEFYDEVVGTWGLAVPFIRSVGLSAVSEPP